MARGNTRHTSIPACTCTVARLRAIAPSAAPGLQVTELQVVTTGDRIQESPARGGGRQGRVRQGDRGGAARGQGGSGRALDQGRARPVGAGPSDRVHPRAGRSARRESFRGRDLPFEQLAAGQRVGTSSLRRSVAARPARVRILPTFPCAEMWTHAFEGGGKATWTQRWLALAGLTRCGAAGSGPRKVLSPELCIPAVGQGALGIECPRGRTIA